MEIEFLRKLVNLPGQPKKTQHLLEAFAIYETMRHGWASSIKAAAAVLGITRGKATVHIKACPQLFEPKVDGGWKCRENVEYHESLEQFVMGLAGMAGLTVRPLVRIGCGSQLSLHFVWDSLRRSDLDWSDFGIHVQSDLPAKIRHQGLNAREFDVIATSFIESDPVSYPKEITKEKLEPFRPYLLVDRNHKRLAGRRSIEPKELDGMTLVLQEIDRSPEISVPAEYLRQTRIVRARSFADAFAMVLGTGGRADICCVGFPQFLPPDQATRLYRIETPRLEPVRVGVINTTDASRDKEHHDRANRIAEVLHNALVRLKESHDSESKNLARLCEDFGRGLSATLNVARTGRGNGHEWIVGEIRNPSITPDGLFRGTHIIYDPFDERRKAQIEFSIHGNIVSNDMDVFEFGWEGRKLRDIHPVDPERKTPKETYTVTLAANKADLSKRLSGTWMGRSTWMDAYKADIGYFFVVTREQANNYGTQVRLWIKEFRDDAASFGHELPELPEPAI